MFFIQIVTHYCYFLHSFPCNSLICFLRAPACCQCTYSWSATQKKRCTAPTLQSTVHACLRVATTVASTSTRSRPGPHQREAAAPRRPPATSPSSSTKHCQSSQKAASRRAAGSAHPLRLPLQGATRCTRSLPATPPHKPCPGRCPRIPRVKLFLWPCPHRPYRPLIITRTCTWAPPPVKQKSFREKWLFVII